MNKKSENVSYGVQKLVMINSGTVDYVHLDLTLPLHLNSENNIGKTSTVNTLQLLYIDSMDDMFMPSSNQDTSVFYFRDEYSYLIFECLSQTGTYCVVLNRSADATRYYSRYIISHAYDEKFFHCHPITF